MYDFKVCKNWFSIDTKRTVQPYNINDDIDFFIFVIDEFPDNYYIFSKQLLYEKGFIKSDTQAGKEGIFIPPPGYTGRSTGKWMLEYINRFDLME